MNPFNWVEIPTTDITRAMKFYEQTFHFTFKLQEMGPMKLAMFPSEMKDPGCAGALVKAEGYTPSHSGATAYFSVQSIEDTLQLAFKNGGKVLETKRSIGQYGFIGFIEDTEGNRLGLHSMQ